jgi:hypothetical protein
MKFRRAPIFVSGILLALGCGGAVENTESVQEPLAGSQAKGPIPAGLPARLEVGLMEDPGQTWMKSSAVPWDMRYHYFTKGWVDNWGYGTRNGSWGLSYLKECDSQGFIPVVEYYQLNDEPGGGEAQFLAKVQTPSTMASYFGDFKILLQRAKEFAKPVVILMEGDGFGLLEQQSAGNPNTYAAIKDSGLGELSALPNTVAGWGLAFLALKNAVGASNVRIGMHISSWASGKDVAYYSVADPLPPEVDKIYGFLAPLGLASNVTGSTYDFLISDPLDRDSDYYRLVQGQGQDRWWDASDSASISSRSFNRYAEWLRLWNVKSGKRWVLWQIPLGNSNHKNVFNNGGSAEGYRDNRPEYFFGGSSAHLAKFADAGVIALLFGAGASGMSSYQNDTYSDGQPFMKSRAGAFLKAGGLPLTSTGSGGAGGSSSTGGSTGSGGSSSTSGGSSSTSTQIRYDFEASAQGWQTSGGMLTSVASSTAQKRSGTHALAVQFNGAADSQSVYVAAPSTPAGATLTFNVWLPQGSAISSVQPFALQGAAGGWTFTGNWQATSGLKTNAWNAISLKVPSNAATPLYQLGVTFTTSSTWTGTAYLDAVSW